jgi:hypothetical protein
MHFSSDAGEIIRMRQHVRNLASDRDQACENAGTQVNQAERLVPRTPVSARETRA